MRIIQTVILLIALSQLTACAVISKKDCLSSDWRAIGYSVGQDGDTNVDDAFDVRKQACAKHGTNANKQLFELGHADGIVDYCQLRNAVQLGVNGTKQAVDNQTCPRRDYPGFERAFEVGYRLNRLRNRARESGLIVADINSRISQLQGQARRASRQLDSGELSASRRQQLALQGRDSRQRAITLSRQAEQARQRQVRDQAIAREYSNSVYDDYLENLSDEIVDPRNKEAAAEAPKQSEFEDRIDDLLSQ